ncbi:MAG: hypothetical protein IKE91_00400 [Clostridia bacterium]|nr:hypothetical protein [Clostridia bacterium]
MNENENIGITNYKDILQRYTDSQLICELAIFEKEKSNLYTKEKELKAELKRRLEG